MDSQKISLEVYYQCLKEINASVTVAEFHLTLNSGLFRKWSINNHFRIHPNSWQEGCPPQPITPAVPWLK